MSHVLHKIIRGIHNESLSRAAVVLLCRHSVLRNCSVRRILRLSRPTFVVRRAYSDKVLSPPSETTNSLKRLMLQARPEKWKLTGAVCLLLVSSSVTMAVPYCIGKVIDIISTPNDQRKEYLQQMCLAFVAIFVVGALANFGRSYLIQTAGQRIVRNIRREAFSTIVTQDVAFFDRNKTGELINRLSSDAALVGNSITLNMSNGMRSSAAALACATMMVYMSPQLAAIGMCTVLPVAGMAIIYGRFVRKITTNVQDRLADATQVAEEKISNIRTVKVFAQEAKEQLNFNEKIDNVLKLQYREALMKAAFFGLAGLSGNMVVLGVLYYGGTLMSVSQITIGNLSAFLMYAAYMGISLGGISGFYSELMRGIGASANLWTIIDNKPEIISGEIIPSLPPKGEIEFRSIVFGYPSRPDVKIFRGLNLMVPAGTVTAVVGSSGSGKSTLGTLLFRFYDPIEGGIYLDGEDIRNLNYDWLRHHISIVSQEPLLFSCSIRENLLYGLKNDAVVSDKMLASAAQEANALEFIDGFPDKFETMVGERGLMLSGGQRQRLAIARALIKNPRILLLDEATSALDSESEHLVQEALERLMHGRTVITIAHRLSTIIHSDQIAVLGRGRIVEMGTYDQLMEIENGAFRKLVEHQTVSADDGD